MRVIRCPRNEPVLKCRWFSCREDGLVEVSEIGLSNWLIPLCVGHARALKDDLVKVIDEIKGDGDDATTKTT